MFPSERQRMRMSVCLSRELKALYSTFSCPISCLPPALGTAKLRSQEHLLKASLQWSRAESHRLGAIMTSQPNLVSYVKQLWSDI